MVPPVTMKGSTARIESNEVINNADALTTIITSANSDDNDNPEDSSADSIIVSEDDDEAMKVLLPSPNMADDSTNGKLTPHDNDVLFGRGFTISAHVGNRHLRQVVQSKKNAFLNAKKKEKRNIARRIVEEIQNDLVPPGRFLIEDPATVDGNNGGGKDEEKEGKKDVDGGGNGGKDGKDQEDKEKDDSGNSGNDKDKDDKEGKEIGSEDKEGIFDKVWILVEKEKAVDKVMHRLREKNKGPLPQEQQQEQQHQNAFQSDPFGTTAAGGVPAAMTRFLQNMEQSAGGTDFLSLAMAQVQAQQQQQQQMFQQSSIHQQQQQQQQPTILSAAQQLSIFQQQQQQQQPAIQSAAQQLSNFPHLNIQQAAASSPPNQNMAAVLSLFGPRSSQSAGMVVPPVASVTQSLTQAMQSQMSQNSRLLNNDMSQSSNDSGFGSSQLATSPVLSSTSTGNTPRNTNQLVQNQINQVQNSATAQQQINMMQSNIAGNVLLGSNNSSNSTSQSSATGLMPGLLPVDNNTRQSSSSMLLQVDNRPQQHTISIRPQSNILNNTMQSNNNVVNNNAMFPPQSAEAMLGLNNNNSNNNNNASQLSFGSHSAESPVLSDSTANTVNNNNTSHPNQPNQRSTEQTQQIEALSNILNAFTSQTSELGLSISSNISSQQQLLSNSQTETRVSTTQQGVLGNTFASQLAASSPILPGLSNKSNSNNNTQSPMGMTNSPILSSSQNQTTTRNTPQFRVITLREWIDASFGNEMTSNYGRSATDSMSSYVTKAIPLAIKLVEFLIQMEENRIAMGDSYDGAVITCENILVRLLEDSGGGDSQHSHRDVVESICVGDTLTDDINSSNNNNNNVPRLFSLGVVLYEVFSSRLGKDVVANVTTSSVNVRRLSLRGNDEIEPTNHNNNDDSNNHRPTKRSQPNTTNSRNNNNNTHGELISHLEVVGIPRSLCALVSNLLGCIHGDLRDDDAYHSLGDVRSDLILMQNDPIHFLDDLPLHQTSFMVGTKFYGREYDISSIEQSYNRHSTNAGRLECGGILVSGGAGVGKSSLVSRTTRDLALNSGAYFLESKFNLNEGASPLSTIAAAFNSLCDMFARDATRDQMEDVAGALHGALGDRSTLLAGMLPSLNKIIPPTQRGSSSGSGDHDDGRLSDECIDLEASMQFLFRTLLEALSEHRRVSFFLDDLQFADPASLRLISSMLSNTMERSRGRVFFACCYRDDDIHEGGAFATWLLSIKMFPLDVMELKNVGVEGVNELVSETLCLSPRITRPLASIVHQKTGGNPLFLRQLLDVLEHQGYIYLNLSPRRWAWDIDKIISLEISDNVVALLIKEMQRLHADLQLCLKVASCMGFCVKYSTFDILSQDLGVNLRELLHQAAQKGYMVRVDETKIRFAHDKIQQAAYEILPSQQRLENHMRFGLVLTSHVLNGGVENDELFFVAVHQINRGGPGVLASNSNQKDMVAALNLRAGKRSMELSDFSTALSLFEHGITFLEEGTCWTTQYAVSLELFDAAVETACALNDAVAVRRLSEQVLANAKCNDDTLNCLYAVVKSLRLAFKLQDSKRVAFTMLEQLGERIPRPIDDITLAANIQEVKLLLQNMSDESILTMKETQTKKRDVLALNLYHDLNFLFQFIDPKRIADTSLRMVQITLSNGSCCMSPLAYAQFAIVLITMGDTGSGYRLGMLALRLLDKINAQRYTSAVIALVGTLVSWVAEPLQSIADSHLLGYKYGQRNGDVVSSSLNYQFYLQVIYFSGQSLSTVRIKSREFGHELLQRKQVFGYNGACLLYQQSAALIEGMDFVEEGEENLPSWENLKSRAGPNSANRDFCLVFACQQYTRAFLFQQYNQIPQEGLLDRITAKSVPLRPIFYVGVFFEGLVSFRLARQTDGEEYRRKGEAALVFMRNWAKCNKWNFENKYLLLEAEMMNFSGYHDQACQLYEDAIRSSNEHKFVHEEAMGSELAASFFFEMGLHQKSYSFYLHSVDCYKKWGALAIVKRVENDILYKFGSSFVQVESIDDSLASIFAQKGSSKRR